MQPLRVHQRTSFPDLTTMPNATPPFQCTSRRIRTLQNQPSTNQADFRQIRVDDGTVPDFTTTTRASVIEVNLVQSQGVINQPACERCQGGNSGLYVECRSVVNQARGACGNCLQLTLGGSCSLVPGEFHVFPCWFGLLRASLMSSLTGWRGESRRRER
jgi:Protein of unknown function (DUF3716)